MIIGVAGGTGSGKTTVAKMLVEALGGDRVTWLSQDSYYVDLSHLTLEKRKQVNFDHPDAFENDLLLAHLQQLRAGEPIEVPIYDFLTYTRTNLTKHVPVRPVVVVEGLMVLTDVRLRDLMDIKVFVDTDADVRVLRRIFRDIQERGRSLASVYEQYLTTVKPMHDAFVEPAKRFADVIIPKGGYNKVALDLLISRVERYLNGQDG